MVNCEVISKHWVSALGVVKVFASYGGTGVKTGRVVDDLVVQV